MSAVTRRLGAALTALLVLTACQSGGDEQPTPTPAKAKPGSEQVEGLAFVPPEGLEKVEKAEQRNPKATLELVGTTKSKAASPTLDVFVERETVGSLQVRSTSILNTLKASLPELKVVRNEKVDVPGALDARVIEVTFSCLVDAEKEEYVPCRQVEVLVQMPSQPQYGLRYGMPASDYTKADVDAYVSSLRVTRS